MNNNHLCHSVHEMGIADWSTDPQLLQFTVFYMTEFEDSSLFDLYEFIVYFMALLQRLFVSNIDTLFTWIYTGTLEISTTAIKTVHRRKNIWTSWSGYLELGSMTILYLWALMFSLRFFRFHGISQDHPSFRYHWFIVVHLIEKISCTRFTTLVNFFVQGYANIPSVALSRDLILSSLESNG